MYLPPKFHMVKDLVSVYGMPFFQDIQHGFLTLIGLNSQVYTLNFGTHYSERGSQNHRKTRGFRQTVSGNSVHAPCKIPLRFLLKAPFNTGKISWQNMEIFIAALLKNITESIEMTPKSQAGEKMTSETSRCGPKTVPEHQTSIVRDVRDRQRTLLESQMWPASVTGVLNVVIRWSRTWNLMKEQPNEERQMAFR
jgi:hypothetical protein